MNYSVSLFPVTLVIGSALILFHVIPLLAPKHATQWLLDFPRSSLWGNLLIAIATLWAASLILTMDLGEFANLRNFMIVGIIIGGILTSKFVEEFLAIRAISILLLLAADILLSAAFLHPAHSRLWLVSLAYAWIFLSLFWVGLPWLLRDWIQWITRTPLRLKIASLIGLTYGVILVISAFVI